MVAQPLTPDEDTFCLAMLEYGGNLGAAYRAAYGQEVAFPVAKAREMLIRPEIAKRIHGLSESIQEHSYVSLGSHLAKLAEIRDMAMDFKQMKVALDAEVRRADVIGMVPPKLPAGHSNNSERPSVVVNIGATPGTVHDWAKQYVDVQSKEIPK